MDPHIERQGNIVEVAKMFTEFRNGKNELGDQNSDWYNAEWKQTHEEDFFRIKNAIEQAISRAQVSTLPGGENRTGIKFPTGHEDHAKMVIRAWLYKPAEEFGLTQAEVDEIPIGETAEEILYKFVDRIRQPHTVH